MISELFEIYAKIRNKEIPQVILDSKYSLSEILNKDITTLENVDIECCDGDILFDIAGNQDSIGLYQMIVEELDSCSDIYASHIFQNGQNIDYVKEKNILEAVSKVFSINYYNYNDLELASLLFDIHDFLYKMPVAEIDLVLEPLIAYINKLLDHYTLNTCDLRSKLQTITDSISVSDFATYNISRFASIEPDEIIKEFDLLQEAQLGDICLDFCSIIPEKEYPSWFVENPAQTASMWNDLKRIAGDEIFNIVSEYGDVDGSTIRRFIDNAEGTNLPISRLIQSNLMLFTTSFAPKQCISVLEITKRCKVEQFSEFLCNLLKHGHIKAFKNIMSLETDLLENLRYHFLNDRKCLDPLLDYDILSIDDWQYILQKQQWSGYKYINAKITMDDFRCLAELPNTYCRLYSMIREIKDDAASYVKKLYTYTALSGFKEEADLQQIAEYLKTNDIIEVYNRHSLGTKLVPLSSALRNMLNYDESVLDMIENTSDSNFLNTNGLFLIPGKSLKESEYSYLRFDFSVNRMKRILDISTVTNQESAGRLLEMLLNGTVERITAFSSWCENSSLNEILKEAVMAELSGTFHEYKYDKNRLQSEIRCKIPDCIVEKWSECTEETIGEFRIRECGDFADLLRLGDEPTVLTYSALSGKQRNLLLSLLNANKKIIEVYKNGRCVAKYLMTLTRYLKAQYVIQGEEKEDVVFSRLKEFYSGKYHLGIIVDKENCNYQAGYSYAEGENALKEFLNNRIANMKDISLLKTSGKEKDACYAMVPYTRSGCQKINSWKVTKAREEGTFFKMYV